MFKIKAGEIIRNKRTREPFLVIGKSPQGVYVVNLKEAIDPAAMMIILPRAERSFEPDKEIIDMNREEADIIRGKLHIVEEIQKTLDLE